jgi:hypothetical protein
MDILCSLGYERRKSFVVRYANRFPFLAHIRQFKLTFSNDLVML